MIKTFSELEAIALLICGIVQGLCLGLFYKSKSDFVVKMIFTIALIIINIVAITSK